MNQVTTDTTARFDPLVVENFFDARACAELPEELRAAAGAAATVYGGRVASGAVEERIRRAERLSPSRETAEFVRRRLLGHRAELAAHFRIELSDCEESQFLRYRVGDFFVAHQDGNTGLLRLERGQARRVSIVIPLSRQRDAPAPGVYCGGSLVFSGRLVGPRGVELPPLREPGALVAFRSETTHEVTPVTHGERYSIVGWFA
jgi:predicted 2-oxoglutarate/Fe(II)-dependent dioxygenase YbiX